MKTEIQTLFARVKPGTINPSTVLDAELEFIWITTACVVNTYDAKRQRTPDQRIVRKATGKYPATVVDLQGRRLHVFENPIIPSTKSGRTPSFDFATDKTLVLLTSRCIYSRMGLERK